MGTAVNQALWSLKILQNFPREGPAGSFGVPSHLPGVIYVCTVQLALVGKIATGSRSTFEFTSRVNLSGPSLYCIARTLG